MNDEMRRIASEIAAAGYVVLVPDLFARGAWFQCIRTLMRELKAGVGRGVSDLLDARAWLAEQAFVARDRVAVMGLCMGGGFALLLARTGLFRVSAPFYGHVPETLEGTCPIVVSYGGRDLIVADHARRLGQMLESVPVQHDMKVYPDAGHSFMNRAPNRALSLLGPFLPVRAAYDPEAARDATARVLKFLDSHL